LKREPQRRDGRTGLYVQTLRGWQYLSRPICGIALVGFFDIIDAYRLPHEELIMAFGIYKPDQGYWTRMMSTVAVGVMALAGAAWMWKELSVVKIGNIEHVYIQAAVVLVLLAVIGYLVYLVYWKNRKTVEFFIATEGEMKKVNWSTRKEIVGSTWVVIIVAAAITGILFVVDMFFSEVFKMAGVLYGESSVVQIFHKIFGGG